jgi:hypothetical protein
MSTADPGSQVDLKQVMTVIAQRLKQGADPDSIVVELSGMGIAEQRARGLVSQVQKRMSSPAPASPTAPAGAEVPGSVLKAVIGGGAGSLIGGVVWAVVAIGTGYEIGYVAWGVGILAGLGVIFGGKAKGAVYQLIAVAASLAGILLGKYLIFVHALKEYLIEKKGAEAAAAVSHFSFTTAVIFVTNLGAVFEAMDLLFIALAVYTAWRMLQVRTVKPAAQA